MCTYRDINYFEQRGDEVTWYEVDVDGVPTAIIMTGARIPEDGAFDELLAKVRVRVHSVVFPPTPYHCLPCELDLYSWPDAQQHLQTTCHHIDFTELMDGSGRCNDCDAELEAPEDDEDE